MLTNCHGQLAWRQLLADAVRRENPAELGNLGPEQKRFCADLFGQGRSREFRADELPGARGLAEGRRTVPASGKLSHSEPTARRCISASRAKKQLRRKSTPVSSIASNPSIAGITRGTGMRAPTRICLNNGRWPIALNTGAVPLHGAAQAFTEVDDRAVAKQFPGEADAGERVTYVSGPFGRVCRAAAVAS